MITCPNCNSTHHVRNGKTSTGSQRYLCKNCGYRFTNNTIFLKITDYFKTNALHLWLEGLPYKYISEIMGFTPETISKFIAPYKEALLPVRKDLASIKDLKLVKNNDLFIGIGSKKVNLPINGSGIILIGNEVEIWGVCRKNI
jgi:hypothetical protein